MKLRTNLDCAIFLHKALKDKETKDLFETGLCSFTSRLAFNHFISYRQMDRLDNFINNQMPPKRIFGCFKFPSCNRSARLKWLKEYIKKHEVKK